MVQRRNIGVRKWMKSTRTKNGIGKGERKRRSRRRSILQERKDRIKRNRRERRRSMSKRYEEK